MALAGTGAALGDKIAAKITAANAPSAAKTQIQTLWQDIASEIINHIVANGQVAAGIPVSTTGTAAAQTGAIVKPPENYQHQ